MDTWNDLMSKAAQFLVQKTERLSDLMKMNKMTFRFL